MNQQAVANLTAAIDTAQAPAVLWSGGKDSTLLMMMARKLGYNLPAIWFRDGVYDHEVLQMAHDLDITLYSWAPANIYLLAYDGSTALISEFSLNGELLPMLTNVRPEAEGKCLANTPRTPKLFMPFDLLLSGYKNCDSHWAADGALLYPEGLVLGTTKMVAPIRHLTDMQVLAELSDLGTPFTERDDCVAICRDCIAGKPLHWDKPLDLTTFRSRIKL